MMNIPPLTSHSSVDRSGAQPTQAAGQMAGADQAALLQGLPGGIGNVRHYTVHLISDLKKKRFCLVNVHDDQCQWTINPAVDPEPHGRRGCPGGWYDPNQRDAFPHRVYRDRRCV